MDKKIRMGQSMLLDYGFWKKREREEYKNVAKNRSTFYCFSPEVMLATFVIEGVLAVYTFLRYRATRFGKLCVAVIALLAFFQLAEYMVCGGIAPALWSQIGFAAIAVLPPLGFHLMETLHRHTRFVRYAYTLSGIFIAAFLFVPRVFEGATCTGNYIIFILSQPFGTIFGAYYFFLLFWALVESARALRHIRREDPERRVLWWLVVGYFSFLFPMTIVYMLFLPARGAVPSIMCGFALLLACILAFRVAPLYRASRS